MLKTYDYPRYHYTRCGDQEARTPARHPVVVVGAGPVGLAAAIDLGQQGVPVVVLDDDDTVSVGSRAVCHAKRALEILDRLGCGDRVVARGVGWNTGRVFLRERQVYQFDLLAESGHERPAFINLQQYYLEECLVERARALEGVELRWKSRLTRALPGDACVRLEIETPDGPYALDADWVIAADGSRSTVRASLGLESRGQVFRDRFLIADVVMKADFPAERWFWFDPPFHPNHSTLLHRQADNVWRIDFQLGADADPEQEKQPDRVVPRIRAMLGEERAFDLEWVSVYTFACRRMDRFRHGRVLFAGDAAHQVSPFGARGGNSGIQDADNLAWKLALVIQGRAPERLLDSYDDERGPAADENILASTRSTDFITPKSRGSRVLRDAVLQLAEHHPFARRLVNSGRLSLPATYAASPLNTPDESPFAGAMVPGAPAVDAPVRVDGVDRWLLRELHGGFVGAWFAGGDASVPPHVAGGLAALAGGAIPVRTLVIVPPGAALTPLYADAPAGFARVVVDREAFVARRYDASPDTFYLFRPDQHVTARWRSFDPAKARAALARASCNH
jgi:3-(3-hydroxy-phenyl)propionate hydroxylase